MANNTFLRIEGIEGESKVEAYKPEIEVRSWSWKGSDLSEIVFTHNDSVASLNLKMCFEQKKTISEAILKIQDPTMYVEVSRKGSENEKGTIVTGSLQLIMQNVIITDFKGPEANGDIISEGPVCLSLRLKEIRFAVKNDRSFSKLKKWADKESSEFETTLIFPSKNLPPAHELADIVLKNCTLKSNPENKPEFIAIRFESSEYILKLSSFCGADNSSPVFEEELKFIRSRREKMKISAGSVKNYPTAKNQLTGLCLSGGGIRSAIFCLGFIQALFRSGFLKRIDYLSTVSGGGYIGSCLTALLSSDIENIDKKIKNSSKEKKIPLLWDECNFPFAMPKLQKKSDTVSESSEFDKECFHGKEKPVTAEKEPVRRLRYYSNYLTAEGNFVKKYFGPVLAFGRGFIFNLLLILPLPILVAVLLTTLYRIPDFNIKFLGLGPIRSHLQMGRLNTELRNHYEAVKMYERFIFYESKNFSSSLTFTDKVAIIKTTPALADKEIGLSAKVSTLKDSIWKEWIGMLILPGIAALCVLAVDLVFMGTKKFNLIGCRFTFSYYSSVCLILFFLAPLTVQVFGAAIVYWNVYKLPNEIAFLSILSLLGPKLLGNSKSGGNGSALWIKIGMAFCLMLLGPVLLLYFTGWMVHSIWARNLSWGCLIIGIIGALFILWLPSRIININKISLHRFYRDRLSRAFQIQHDGDNPKKNATPFQRIYSNDRIELAKLYDNSGTIGPYPIINTNLNQTKELPKKERDGVFRTSENFIFSKHWCGSSITGYIRTDEYQKKDQHIDLATAVAISGAAANIGMGSGNMPVFRLLMALLNVRLGYWAPNPGSITSKPNWVLFGNTPGTWTLIKEMFGVYSRKSDYINLSDGGHFDNLGVYEMLRRRCKYIIVADAEADPLMKFQGLAYIIRLARVDFGIMIEIDLSGLKLDKVSNVSKNHCVVGTIKYPDDSEIGYIFYCKSSVTGDLPQHLYEYRVKHPTFPHQTTADQWFDEQQFEVYRELGYHVGRDSVRPVTSLTNSKIDDKMSTEDIFVQLKQHWYPSPPDMEVRSERYATELNRIVEIIKNDKKLRFMDAQIYPEWRYLMGSNGKPHDTNLWLPDDPGEISAGFYVSSLMIQLMENVYTGLKLDETYDHPGNSEWMNLFMHWAWSGMFKVTWTITACTFSGDFQNFCKRHLKLDFGEIIAEPIIKDMKSCLDSENKFRLSKKVKKSISANLNPYEITRIDKFLDTLREKKIEYPDFCHSFCMIIKNPINEMQHKKIYFGFSLSRFKCDTVELIYFRIQDHLRRIGLGRLALGKLH